MFCANCGKEIPVDSKFCQGCGALQGGEVKTAVEHKKRKRKKWIVLIAAITIVCVGFGIGFLVFHMNRGIQGSWMVESLNGMTLEEYGRQSGEEVAVNILIEKDTIAISVKNVVSKDVSTMKLRYEKKDHNVWEAYLADQSQSQSPSQFPVIALNYDSSSDKITVTISDTSEEVKMVLVRSTTDFTDEDFTDNTDKYEERLRENKDMQTLDAIYWAFVASVAELGIDTYDNTELSGELAEKMESNLGRPIEEYKERFVSEVCKGQDLYFYANTATEEFSVAVGSREGVHGVAKPDCVFLISN